MRCEAERATVTRWLRPIGLAEAEARVGEWWAQGWVVFTELATKSTRLRRVEPWER